MNLNNIFKKVTGVALAATLSFGAFAGNAFAAETDPINGENSTKASTEAPTLKKTVTGGNYFGGGTFNFTVTPDKAPDGTYKGYTSRPAANFLSLQNSGALTLQPGVKEGELTVNIDQAAVNNVLPGVYRFNITENDTTIAGITKDPSTMTVDAFVTTTNGTDRKVEYFIVSENGQKANLNFENKLETQDITLTKTISGNQANLSDKFTFNIVVSSATDKTVSYTITDASGTAKTGQVTTGKGISSTQMTNGSTIKIEGLAAGDKLAVSETDSNNYGGYEATATYNGADVIKNQSLPVTDASFTVAAGGDTIQWTNSRKAEIPTGLIENIAPFVLAIAAAGVIFFVYFNRDKNEEEQYA
ncbi:Spy0128 family protein [Anaerococcus sp. DFU013_CI05]|uniref:DUF7601 domain-containing protein n=1 Tax=Anaerococcus sp. AH8042_DFU013_CI05 TaxID=3385202 RepID=UPI003A5214B2